MHAKHYKHNEDGHTAPGVYGNGSVPLSHSGNVVTRIGIHTHIYIVFKRRIGCSPCTQEVAVRLPLGGKCPNDFSDPIDQETRTQWALSWKIVISEWRSVIAVSLNVGGGDRLIKPANLCMCTQNTTNTTRTDARRRMCAAMVPYRWATRGTSLRELEYTHIYLYLSSGEPGLVDRMLALHTRNRGFDSHRGHMSKRFFRSNSPGNYATRELWAGK